jgi:hypothetical protein
MWKEIMAKALVLIKFAETLAGKTGPEKRAIVVAGLCKAINIPFMPDWMEGLLEPPAYGFIIDWAVGFWNRVTGHNLDLIPESEEVTEKLTEAVKIELKAAALGVLSGKPDDGLEPAGDTVDEKFNSLLEKYAVK